MGSIMGSMLLGFLLISSSWAAPLSGVGVAVNQAVTGTATSLTGSLSLGESQWGQLYAGLASTTPLQFGVGVLFKKIFLDRGGPVALYWGAGLGGGLTAGGFSSSGSALAAFLSGASSSVSSFFLSAVGVGGCLVRLPQIEPLVLSLDAGVTFSWVSSTPNFALGGLSPALGLNIIYIF